MNELVVICEGETELTFVRDQLAAHLPRFGTNTWGVLPGRRRRHGGVKKWKVTRDDIVRTLKENRHVSTMFDYYGLPTDWPGREDASSLPWDQRAAHVESRLLADITNTMSGNFNSDFFVPYIQLHEFESLLFSDIDQLVAVTEPICNQSADQLRTYFSGILDDVGHPEAINDHYDTCPSRRIKKKIPGYRKRIHGPVVTLRIGLERIKSQCEHFSVWIDKLETLR